MTEQRDFFISYNSADAAHAEAINSALRDAGYTTHFAGTDLPLGGNIPIWMDNALFTSTQVLALCSPDYFKQDAKYSEAERSAAFWADPTGAQAKIIPVEIAPTDYRPLYKPLRRVSETSGAAPERAAALLVEALKAQDFTQRREDLRAAGATPKIFFVARNRSQHFHGRDGALADLQGKLAAGKTTAITQSITGMGGIGKTTLAAEYAHRFGTAGRYAGVWWVSSESEASLIEGLAALARRLGMQEQQDTGAMARAALEAVGAVGSLPWLMIYDNVPNPDALAARNLDGSVRHSWLPAGNARVIITSRWEDFGKLADTAKLNIWDLETTTAFLLDVTGRDDRDGAEALAMALGGLPLAAEQAAAYLARMQGISFESYTQNLASLIDRAPTEGTLGDYGRTVYASLSIALKDLPQATKDLLCLLSWLSEDGTEQELIAAVAEAAPDSLSNDLTTAFCDEFQREEVIQSAADLSLLDRKVGDGIAMLNLHRVTAMVIRLWQERENVTGWDDRASGAVRVLFPSFVADTPSSWQLCSILLPHAWALAARGPADGKGAEARAYVLNQAALYLRARGDVEGGIALLENALDLARLTQGEMNANFAGSLLNLAGLYKISGRFKEAETALWRVREIASTVLPPDDRRNAIADNNLGNLYVEQMEFAKAEPLLQHALVTEERACGRISAEYASSLNSLGALYGNWARQRGQSYRRADAIKLYFQAVDVGRLAVGERHDLVSISLRNLAVTQKHQSEFAAGALNAARAVAIQLSLGQIRHPSTQEMLLDLCSLWESSGDPGKASQLKAGDPTDLLPEIEEVERLMHEWVAANPDQRHFGPPPFSRHHGDLPV
ncbi:MAG: TIR domain-containing protein [Pseudomonadota bacterium]